jgi:M6 family metalloprotease-like protein
MSVSALEPPTPEQVREYKKAGVWAERQRDAMAIGNHRMDPEVAARADYKLRNLYYQSIGRSDREINQLLTPPPAWRGMPTTGNVKIFILLIEFNDYRHITPTDEQAAVNTQIFGEEDTGSVNYPYESLSAYYDRSSYGLLNLQGATLGWYNPGTYRSAVTETDAGREALIKSAINSFDAGGHDFSQYDNDGDGDIDYFAVIWTGPHGAWSSFWWGYQTWFYDDAYIIDGKKLGKYSWQWESYNYPSDSFTPLVLIHETGHALGLPDYYDYNSDVGPDGGVGGLDMMDHNWGDHNAFSKFVLDWLTPSVVTTVGAYPEQHLYPSSSQADALLIMPNATGSPFEEFFMVQYRKREANDITYPTDGLVIWHVNAILNAIESDYVYDNSYTEYKLLRLMEADGREEIEGFSASADASDFYTPDNSFTHDTMPNSNDYDNHPTGVQVTDIVSSGTYMDCNVAITDVPSVSITTPAPLAAVNGTVAVTADASASSGIAQVAFFAEGLSIGIDTTAPYSVNWNTAALASGMYTLRAEAMDTVGMINSNQISVFCVAGETQALILDLGSDNDSGLAIGTALAKNNIKPVFASAVAAINPTVYPAAFVCLGYYDGNHVLTSAESGYLATYLNNGGRLYMEGGDIWFYDAQYPIHDYFGINGVADGGGDNDLAIITGSANSLAQGLSFTAGGIYNWVDHLETEAGGVAVWANSSPAYTCGVSRQTDTYRTIGCSFEFGNIPDESTRTQAMAAYISFFEVVVVVTPPPPPPSGSKAFLPAIYNLLLLE